jgi:protocatechuate 3,4-dioxygenase beta subunit
MENHDKDVNDLGLAADLAMLRRSPLDRRRILKMGVAGIGLLLAGCDVVFAQTETVPSAYLPLIVKPAAATPTPTTAPTTTPTTTPTATTTPTTCVGEIPQEIAGPYPADGSNASNQTLNVLTRSGIVRSDIRTSIGTGNTAPGVPFTIELTLVDSNSNCAPLVGYAVYLWHCNRDGQYSLYSSGVTNEDYLRGVQATDSNGKVTFTSIFPGCYAGRWPHVHFEVYRSLAQATASGNVIHTSQMALPQATCETIYATSGYSASVQNLSRITLASDNVFGDGYSTQMATVSGDVTNGSTAQLTVGINV